MELHQLVLVLICFTPCILGQNSSYGVSECSVKRSLDIDVKNKDKVCFSARTLPDKEQVFTMTLTTKNNDEIKVKLEREYAKITQENRHGLIPKDIHLTGFVGDKPDWREFCFSLDDFSLRCEGGILVPKGEIEPSDVQSISLRRGEFMNTCDEVLEPVPGTVIEYTINYNSDFVPAFRIANIDLIIENYGNNLYASIYRTKGLKESNMLKKGKAHTIEIHLRNLSNELEIGVFHHERGLFRTRIPGNNISLELYSAFGTFFYSRKEYPAKFDDLMDKQGLLWMIIGTITALVSISIPVNLFVALYSKKQLSMVTLKKNKNGYEQDSDSYDIGDDGDDEDDDYDVPGIIQGSVTGHESRIVVRGQGNFHAMRDMMVRRSVILSQHFFPASFGKPRA